MQCFQLFRIFNFNITRLGFKCYSEQTFNTECISSITHRAHKSTFGDIKWKPVPSQTPDGPSQCSEFRATILKMKIRQNLRLSLELLGNGNMCHVTIGITQRTFAESFYPLTRKLSAIHSVTFCPIHCLSYVMSNCNKNIISLMMINSAISQCEMIQKHIFYKTFFDRL